MKKLDNEIKITDDSYKDLEGFTHDKLDRVELSIMSYPYIVTLDAAGCRRLARWLFAQARRIEACSRCGGTGKLQDFSTSMDNFIECTTCHGSGKK